MVWILGLDPGSREKIKLLKITVLGKLAKCAPGLYIGKQYSINIKFLNLITILRLFKESVPQKEDGWLPGTGEEG